MLFVGREAIAGGVGHHGDTLCLGDPANGFLQAGPALGHVPGLAIGQVVLEHLGDVLADAGLHQMACKVGARDQGRVAHIAQCAFVGVGDAHGLQLAAHLLGAWAAAVAQVGQTLLQRRMFRINAQPDDVHAGLGKADGDFDPGQKVQPLRGGRLLGGRDAGQLIVVGQRPQRDAGRAGALRQLCGREGSIRKRGMAVKVGMEPGRHGVGDSRVV